MHTEIVWPMGGETSQISTEINQFLDEFSPLEKCLSVLYDQKSKAHYVCCHLSSKSIQEKMDFEATIYEDDLDEESSSGNLYKLNRDITENQYAFAVMKSDAQAGRSFEDIVVEYDKAYNSAFPLKIYGGQHRVKAILTANGMDNMYHGFRVYFSLTKEQKVEIATVNNTSIAVSNDLIDRMKEQLLGTELRDFFQEIKLLEENQDFSDSKNGDVPTVRVARTFVLNYWRAKSVDQSETFHIPSVCKSGGLDVEYEKVRSIVNWTDEAFLNAGRAFRELHITQKDKVAKRKKDKSIQFASKALSLAVVAGWSYIAGFYSTNNEKLAVLYALVKNLGVDEDPMGARALADARMKGVDPDTYRGIGARINPDELGRMFEVFFVLINRSSEKKITKSLANAAIQSYEAKKAMQKANLSLSKI